ncbi:class I SAM-dependent methyltransferase, partial [Arthrospira platensis SPKY1]|nr:class I SAM-dependent methyltransferase [Arthrospira platensis SPKY1]
MYAVDHILRYLFLGRWIRGKTVLDAACGTGFGSAILSREGAISVTGIDHCAEVVEQCRLNYPDSQVQFHHSSLENLGDLKLPDFD